MTHKIGMHWIRTHPDQGDLPHVQRMGYRSIKLFEWNWSDKDFCLALLPMLRADALILARDHPLSEQHADMWRNPAATGKRHADEWHAKVMWGKYHLPVDRTRFLGINEPDATNGDRDAIDIYNASFLNGLREWGAKGGAFNFSTGHPRTVDGTGNTQADYSVFERSHKAIVEGGHIAVLHIYGTAAQPCVPGHYDRLRACTWQDVQWIVGECGIDEHVIGGGPHDGFQVPYAGQLNNYVGWLDALILGVNDPRIHSWMPFTYDFSHPWSTFDVRPIREAMEAYQWQHAIASPTPAPPVEIHLPIIQNGGPVSTPQPETPSGDLFEPVMKFIRRWEGGFVNDPRDLGGATNMGITIGTLSAWRQAHGMPVATVDDVRNLTRSEADAIYREWYWEPSGAAQAKDYATALLLMDSGVLHGVGAPQAWVKEYGFDPFAIAARRLRVYTGKDAVQWDAFGRGWTNRVADLLGEIGKAA